MEEQKCEKPQSDDFRIHLINEQYNLLLEDKSIINKMKSSSLKKKMPNTPLLLLTSEGADRLAAEVAKEEGIKYIAISPLPEEYYKKDFPNTIRRS